MKRAWWTGMVFWLLLATLPAQAARREPKKRIAAGYYHTCALTASGKVYCWGSNGWGQLGNGTKDGSEICKVGDDKYPCSTTPVAVKGLSDPVALAAGNAHTCALTASRKVYCWGGNGAGQLGNGTDDGPEICKVGHDKYPCSTTPIAVKGLSDPVALAAGEGHTCALTASGKVYCWGRNDEGQLGNGTNDGPETCSDYYPCSTTPGAVQGLSDVVAIAAGQDHTCALTASGNLSAVTDTAQAGVYCWGDNGWGQLGNGTDNGSEFCSDFDTDNAESPCSTTPVAVKGLSDPVALAAGYAHTCALTASGKVYCWGENGAGQLGNGSENASSTPVSVKGLSDVSAIAAGWDYTCALTASGKVYCWGENNSGQLGNGTKDGPEICEFGDKYSCSTTPVTVEGLSDPVALASGDDHTCALTASGKVYCWGDNDSGQLGNGSKNDSSTPVPVRPPRPKFPPSLIASVSFWDASGDGILEAKEEGTLRVVIQNQGRGEAYELEVVVEDEAKLSGLSAGKAELWKLAPGENETLSISLSSSRLLPDGQASLLVKVKEGNGFDADPVRITFQTKAFAYPELLLTDLGVDTAGGVIRLGQEVTVKAIVQNQGKGRAENVKAQVLLHGENLFLASRTDTFSLGNLAPGDWKEVEFSFFTNKRYAGPKKLPVALKLTETRGPVEQTFPLNLELEKSVPSIAQVTVRAKRTHPLRKEPPKLTSDADILPDAGAEYRDTVHIVAIGISDYKSSEIPAIPYAAHDAAMFARFLQQAGGVPPGRVKLLANEDATGNTIKGVLKDWLGSHVREDDTVLVYYAGHGAPDPRGKEEAYLVPYDGDPDFPSTMIAREELARILQSLPTKKVLVVLDSCFSGKGRSVIAKAGRLFVLSIESPLWLGVTVLAAASGNQISHDYAQGKHGLFTYYLLKGMQGKADADGDGEVTLKEVYDYVRQQVPKASLSSGIGEEQDPTLLPNDEALKRFERFVLTQVK